MGLWKSHRNYKTAGKDAAAMLCVDVVSTLVFSWCHGQHAPGMLSMLADCMATMKPNSQEQMHIKRDTKHAAVMKSIVGVLRHAPGTHRLERLERRLDARFDMFDIL